MVTSGHIIRSVIAENPTLCVNLMALLFIEPELWLIKALHCGYRDFDLSCSRDLDLDLMTFIYEYHF